MHFQCTIDLLAVETRLAIIVRKQLLHRGMLFNSATAFVPGHLLHIIAHVFHSKLVNQMSVHILYTLQCSSTMFTIQTLLLEIEALEILLSMIKE